MSRQDSVAWVCSARPELTAGIVGLIRSQVRWQVLGVSAELAAAAAALREHPGAFLVFIPPVAGAPQPLDHQSLSVIRSRTLVVAPANSQQWLTALRLGTVGMVHAAQVTRDLPLALAAVRDGIAWCRIELMPVLTEALDQRGLLTEETPRLETLSVREREVLFLVARGFSNREIAEQLELSVKTVETYKHRVMLRLHLRNRRELVLLVRRAGWLQASHDPMGWRPEGVAR